MSSPVCAASGHPFTADAANIRWFGERIVAALAGAVPRRVLDIGCGDGALLVYLADRLPESVFVGVDLSDVNIAAAARRISASPHASRITVVRGDYLRLDEGPFNAIVASSSLQGMDATRTALASKLARDTAPGGFLVHFTPYRSVYNSTLNTIRWVLRQVRGPATDRLILIIARTLHPAHPLDTLRQRVDYMYTVPRHDEEGLRDALQRHGFHIVGTEPAPHTSVGQAKHRLAVMSAPRE